MRERNDAELVRRCVEGDGEAWGEFVERFAEDLARTLGKVIRTNAPALARLLPVEDAVQESFAHFLRDECRVLRGYDGRSPLGTYLRVVAIRHTFSLLEKQARFLRSTREVPADPADREPPEPISTAVKNEQADLLRKALARLPLRERLVLKWIRQEGLTYRQAARLLGISLRSVETLLEKGQKRLREHFPSDLS